MKKLIIILIFLCITNHSKLYANTNDSLTLTELKNAIAELNIEYEKLKEKKITLLKQERVKENSSANTFEKTLKTHPVKFAWGVMKKRALGSGEHLNVGLAMKFSFKKWNYKHYIYAEPSIFLKNFMWVDIAVGYLYNFYNGLLLGASFDVLTLRPAVILSYMTPNYFIDVQVSSKGFEDRVGHFGFGFGLGKCF